jgi:son of sevenless
MDQDDFENVVDSSTPLDVSVLERMDDMKRAVLGSIRRLDEQLVVADKVVTPARHEQLSTAICTAAIKVVENLRPCIAMVESLNLSPLGAASQTPQIIDFAAHKQRLYDLSGALVVACQTVAGPLSDEWAENRGESFEERIKEVKTIMKQLETSVSQMSYCVQTLLSRKPSEKSSRSEPHRRKESHPEYNTGHMRSASRAKSRQILGEGSPQGAFGDPFEPSTDTFREKPKLGQFFGVSVQEETPEYLRLDHESELAWDTKIDPPQLRGGTLTALVEQLTRHDRLDTSFNNTFLLTYRSFTTASELFEMLVKRFTVQPPRGISQENYRTWVERKQKPIRFRVVNILKSWFDSYWMEGRDEASMELLRRVHAFAKESVATSTTPGSGPLITVIDQRLKGHDPMSRRLVPNLNGQAPTPIVPKNMKKLRFMDIDPTEFARQLTLIEYSLYGKIKATECLNKTWQKKVGPEEEDPAPNVKALILHSNQLTNWVAEAILAQNDARKRATVIKHFVTVADVRFYLSSGRTNC